MTVYVDDMRAQYGRLVMCHMIADSDEELRAMAQQIDVRQRWHQGDHFDICLSKRELAVRFGAIEITLRQCAAMNFRRKITGELGGPGDAEEWMIQALESRRQQGVFHLSSKPCSAPLVLPHTAPDPQL